MFEAFFLAQRIFVGGNLASVIIQHVNIPYRRTDIVTYRAAIAAINKH